MAKIESKVEDIQQLQEELLKMNETIDRRIDMKLCQLVEYAVTYAKEHKGYKYRTANLKNSISYALNKDCEIVPYW